MGTTPIGEWPPPAEEVWLLHGTMGAAVGTVDGDGVDRGVLLRLAARRNQSTEQLDVTLLLELDTVAEVMVGLLSTANAAFGRPAMQDAMARALSMTEQDVAATKARLKDEL